MFQKAIYALSDNQLFLNFILLKMYRKQYHCAQFNAYQINKKPAYFLVKCLLIHVYVRKWQNGFLDKTDVTIISPTPLPDK